MPSSALQPSDRENRGRATNKTPPGGDASQGRQDLLSVHHLSRVFARITLGDGTAGAQEASLLLMLPSLSLLLLLDSGGVPPLDTAPLPSSYEKKPQRTKRAPQRGRQTNCAAPRAILTLVTRLLLVPPPAPTRERARKQEHRTQRAPRKRPPPRKNNSGPAGETDPAAHIVLIP